MTSFLDTPRIPSSAVRTVIISGKYRNLFEEALAKLSISVLKTEPNLNLSKPVSYHADMQFFCAGNNEIVTLQRNKLIKTLNKLGFSVTETANCPSKTYPNDILCNAFILDKRLFGKLEFIDKVIIDYCKKNKIELIDVKQGYTACSTCIVDKKSIITADSTIAETVRKQGVEALLIEPGHIELHGYDYGFIGGCCGLIDKNKIAFTGNINTHPSANQIKEFLDKLGIEIISLANGNLIDIGGIIPILQTS